MNKKKIVALDFDRTLFDTEHFKIALANSLKEHNISPKIWWQTYKSSIPKNLTKYQIYLPKKHAELIKKITGVPEKKILDSFDQIIKKSSRFVFKDTKKALSFLKKKNFKLYLVTFGNKKHQEEKIKHSRLKKYFNKIIFSEKPKAFIKFPKNIIIVDDNIEEIKNLYKKYKNQATLIWLNYKNKKTKIPKSIIQIKNLKSIIKQFSNETIKQ